MIVAMCAPYPFDERDRATGDGLMESVVTLSRALAKQSEIDLHVISRSPRIAETTSRIVTGVKVTWVPDPWPSLDYLTGRWVVRQRLRRAIARIRPSIVHAHGEAPFIRAALDSSVPHVITLHGIFERQTRAYGNAAPLSFRVAYALMRQWEAAYVPRIRHLIAINSTIADYVKSRSPGVTIERIKNPVDVEFFEAENHETVPTILFVGQISRLKGVDVLIDAFARLTRCHSTCLLRIVGDRIQDPRYASELEHQYQELIDAGRVVFTGPQARSAVRRELERCSVLCLPSYYEASPIVVREAMAAAKPVVATNVGDVAELLGSGAAGATVDTGDPAALASALDSMLRDPAKRKRVGERGRQLALELASPDSIARQTLDFYRQIVSHRSSSRH
jgi:glycosyltransferase involved in cell wall biosynthesis